MNDFTPEQIKRVRELLSNHYVSEDHSLTIESDLFKEFGLSINQAYEIVGEHIFTLPIPPAVPAIRQSPA